MNAVLPGQRVTTPGDLVSDSTPNTCTIVSNRSPVITPKSAPKTKKTKRRITLKHGRQLEVPVGITNMDRSIFVHTNALIDSGCSDSFVDRRFIQEHGIPTVPLPDPSPVVNGDGTNSGSDIIRDMCTLHLSIKGHREDILFLVHDLDDLPIYLGHDWLQQHNPTLDWVAGTIEFDRVTLYPRPTWTISFVTHRLLLGITSSKWITKDISMAKIDL